MPSILHISDLHRTPGHLLTNDEIFAAVASDAVRWQTEGIPSPDIVVVSGDVIQGVPIGTSEADAEIAIQYAEASDFIRRLAAEFVDSDRSRVVIIPGNHDVHWDRSRNAMAPLATCPPRISINALQPTSNIRWDWRHQKPYEIIDRNIYDSRLDHFRRFQADFYAGLDPGPLSYGDGNLVFFDYPSLGIMIVGFASWHGLDCYCHVGEIDVASLALSRELRSGSTAPVAVAVWHHSVVGGPRENDYMDQRVLHKLIDFGFNVGLHGHQHYPGAAPFELRLPNMTSMAVVGAGSLAAGDHGLPMGEQRQFNIVEIDPKRESITVHVRAMSSSGVFTASYRDDFGGKPYTCLSLPDSPLRPKPPTSIQLLDRAITAVTNREYQRALECVAEIESEHPHEGRKVMISALEGMGCHNELIAVLNPPQSADEAILAFSMLLDAGRLDEAAARLSAAAEFVDSAHLEELEKTIAVKRMIS